jgi:hypothetical protein
MSKPFTFVIALFLLASALLVIAPEDVEGSSMQSPDRQVIKFYMFGPGDDGNLNLSSPSSSEDQEEECPSDGNFQTSSSTVGTWVSEPFTGRCNFSGNVDISLWAKGDVRNVQFTIDVSLNGNNGQSFQTQTMNTESTPQLFSANGNINMGPSAGDRIHITIEFDGGEENPLTAGDHQAYIVYGSTGHPSGLKGPMDTVYFDYRQSNIEVYDQNSEDNPETIMVTATIYDALGSSDLIDLDFKAETNDFVGDSYDFNIIETTDEYVTIKWIWEYGNDHAPSGGYELNVTAMDITGNTWWRTQDIRIVTQVRPKVDFVIEDLDISTDPSPVYAGNTASINALVHCYGESGLIGFIPRVNVVVTTPLGGTKEFILHPTIDSNSDTLIQVDYLFNMTGVYTIAVEVNPSIGKNYEEYNELGDADENNDGLLTITVTSEPKKDDDGEWYEPDEIRQTLEDEPIYGAGIAAAIVVIVVVSIILIRKRREDDEDYDDYDDDDDYEL